MTIKTLLAAAAATALLAGAAQAQDSMPNQAQPADPTTSQTGVPSVDSTRPTGADAGKTNMPSGEVNATTSGTDASASADAATSMPAATSMGTDASAVVATNVVTNGPIADTPENRAKYGQPMSRAGKRTSAKGN